MGKPPDFSRWRETGIVDLYAVPQDETGRACRIVGVAQGKTDPKTEKIVESLGEKLEDYRFGRLVKRTDPSGNAGSQAISIFETYAIAFWGVADDEEDWLQGILDESGAWRILEKGEEYEFDFFFNEKTMSLFSVAIELGGHILRIIRKPSEKLS